MFINLLGFLLLPSSIEFAIWNCLILPDYAVLLFSDGDISYFLVLGCFQIEYDKGDEAVWTETKFTRVGWNFSRSEIFYTWVGGRISSFSIFWISMKLNRIPTSSNKTKIKWKARSITLSWLENCNNFNFAKKKKTFKKFRKSFTFLNELPSSAIIKRNKFIFLLSSNKIKIKIWRRNLRKITTYGKVEKPPPSTCLQFLKNIRGS